MWLASNVPAHPILAQLPNVLIYSCSLLAYFVPPLHIKVYTVCNILGPDEQTTGFLWMEMTRKKITTPSKDSHFDCEYT